MGREVLTVNIGGCGIKLGEIVWRQYCTEHGIDQNGVMSKQYYDSPIDLFEETSSGKYIPRTLMIDLDPASIDDVKSSQIFCGLINDFLISGNKDSASNFAYGYYSTESKELINKFNDRIRKLVDNCDNLEGFIFHHAVGGGTGSGLASVILERIAVDYRKKAKVGFEIYPGAFTDNHSNEIYNSLLITHWLLDHTEVSYVFDNRKVHKLAVFPDYNHMNVLIAKVASSITRSLRYYPDINMDVRFGNMTANLVPFPRLHFITPSIAPILSDNSIKKIYIKDAITKTLIDGFIRRSLPQSATIATHNLKYEAPLYKELMYLIYCSHTGINCMDIFQKKYDKQYYLLNNQQDLFEMCCDPEYFMVECLDFDAEQDKNMAISVQCNGNFNWKDVNAAVQLLKTNKKVVFVEWCPTGFKVNYNKQKLPIITNCEYDKMVETDSVNMVFNNTLISRFFTSRISQKFDKMYHKKQFVSLYLNEGMETGEFDEARVDLGFLEKDYLDVLSEQATDEYDTDDY